MKTIDPKNQEEFDKWLDEYLDDFLTQLANKSGRIVRYNLDAKLQEINIFLI